MEGLVTTPGSQWELALRLLFAAIFGGIIGWERETHDRPAGLRTHMLVCVGSALLMAVSLSVATSFMGKAPADPGRIAAQVVSGIGFLGAGTILREGATVRGLTTAASLWVVAALGLAEGAGLHLAAGLSTLGAVATLGLLSRVERLWFYRRNRRPLRIKIADRPGKLGEVAEVLGHHGVDIKTVNLQPESNSSTVTISMTVQFPKHFRHSALNSDLMAIDDVRAIEMEE